LALIEKLQIKIKKLLISTLNLMFAQNVGILKYLESKPFATFKQPFATCGEWRMGWATLI